MKNERRSVRGGGAGRREVRNIMVPGGTVRYVEVIVRYSSRKMKNNERPAVHIVRWGRGRPGREGTRG